MATAVSTVGAANKAPLSLNGSNVGATVPTSAFMGCSLKKPNSVRFPSSSRACSMTIKAADYNEEKQTSTDRWAHLATDQSDDQLDIRRGKGAVDSLFQAAENMGTHVVVQSSWEYESSGLKKYTMDNMSGDFYIAPAFMDKLVVHITKNYLNLPNIKVPLILGIWGGKGQGKSFQCELVFAKMGIT